MKRITLIIIFLNTLNQLSAQAIKVQTVFSISDYNKFQNNFGYGLGYDILLKSKNQLSFAFSHTFSFTDYSDTCSFMPDPSIFYRDVKPKNQRLSLSTCYSFNIHHRAKSDFFIGPKIGINHFKINEFVIQRQENQNQNETNSFTINEWEKIRIGLGLPLEYKRNVLSDKLSLSFSAEPEVTFLPFRLIGSTSPRIIGWLNFSLNIIFNLQKSKIPAPN